MWVLIRAKQAEIRRKNMPADLTEPKNVDLEVKPLPKALEVETFTPQMVQSPVTVPMSAQTPATESNDLTTQLAAALLASLTSSKSKPERPKLAQAPVYQPPMMTQSPIQPVEPLLYFQQAFHRPVFMQP